MRKLNSKRKRKLFQTNCLHQQSAIAAFLAVLFGLLPASLRAQSPPVVWSRLITGPYYASQGDIGIALDQQDNFYYAGGFATQLFPVGNQTLTNWSTYGEAAAQNGFIAKFSKTGDFLWVRQIGGTRFDAAGPCATDANGDVLVTGVV